MAQPIKKTGNLPTLKQSSLPSARPSNSKPTVKSAPSKPLEKPAIRSQSRPSNNAYKKGKLSKNARFSPRRIKWKPIIILLFVIASIVSALILGNHLNKKVEQSQSATTTQDDISIIVPPSADKVAPQNKLHAYFADMKYADPKQTLSNLTAIARSKGNALLVNIKNENGAIIYSSDKVKELGFEHQENLTLTRLKNHFEYYNDFALGFFSSDFSANLDSEKALILQTNEILLLKEATDVAFGQIIVEFSENITKSNLIHYQTYLLNLKLACPTTPVGVVLSTDFLSNTNNAGNVAGILNVADFFVLDLGKRTATEIKGVLAPLVYFTERYNCVMMLSSEDETTLDEKISALESTGIENYIIK